MLNTWIVPNDMKVGIFKVITRKPLRNNLSNYCYILTNIYKSLFLVLGELYRLIIPILENRRDYTGLTQCYEHLAQSYSKVNEVNRSGKRMLGRFYRVVFFGQVREREMPMN